MTLISLTDCCRLLAIDSKTLRRWLAQAQFPLQPHPGDARLKGMTADQLRLARHSPSSQPSGSARGASCACSHWTPTGAVPVTTGAARSAPAAARPAG